MPCFTTRPLPPTHPHYARMASVIEYLCRHRAEQPELKNLAPLAAMSECHLQRTFKEWVGLTPKQFLQVLNKEYAKRRLRQSSVSDVALSSGLSGGARLHDLMITYEAVTPGEYRSGGETLTLRYGCHPCAFGHAFAVLSERGLVALHFIDTPEQAGACLDMLRVQWPQARFCEEQPAIAQSLSPLLTRPPVPGESLRLYLRGTPFQVKVWEALMAIPYGELCSYQDVARLIGSEKSVRAVASAVAHNHIAYLIPCHRVIRSTGEINQYRWHSTRKSALLAWEHANTTMIQESDAEPRV